MIHQFDREPLVLGPLTLRVEVQRWGYLKPFTIAGYTRDGIDVIEVVLGYEGHIGRGEAAGVRYRRETVTSMVGQIEGHRASLERGISRQSLQRLLPSGGARNALDCALWDLEAKVLEQPVWRLAGLQPPRPLPTVVTCGADTPEKMAAHARSFPDARALKLKLTGEAEDVQRIRAVREARADVWLSVDANQALTLESLEKLMPILVDTQVKLIEQPLPVGQEMILDGFQSPIPLAADESVQDRADLPRVAGRFSAINIKLDKCGGLTEGLALARAAQSEGLEVMVGNMGNTSLAMAPAFLVGQFCHVVDLDGPLFLKHDRVPEAEYTDGLIRCPDALWGYATKRHADRRPA